MLYRRHTYILHVSIVCCGQNGDFGRLYDNNLDLFGVIVYIQPILHRYQMEHHLSFCRNIKLCDLFINIMHEYSSLHVASL